MKNGIKKGLRYLAIIAIITNLYGCGRQISAKLSVGEVKDLTIEYRDSIVRKLIQQKN